MNPELVEDRTRVIIPSTDRCGSDTDLPTVGLRSVAQKIDQKTDAPSEVAAAAEQATNLVVAIPQVAKDPFPQIGDRFQDFQVLSELGRGAMGRVFLARQQAPTNRIVVLKVGQYLSGECQKLAKLQHPNIVPVYSFHQTSRVQAVCMPYRGPLTLGHLATRLRHENLQTLDGRVLTTFIEECRKSRQDSVVEPVASLGASAQEVKTPVGHVVPDRLLSLFTGLRSLNYNDAVLTIMRQVVEGLRVAHEARIVHCDLKPANVLLADDGYAQLIDFGISFDKSTLATEQRRFGGTRPYMSPEQLKSCMTTELEYDERTDLYAVGVILYELLTGNYPFESDLDWTLAGLERDLANRFNKPPSIRSFNPRLPVAIESIVNKCLAPQTADRYQSAVHLLEDLDRQIARKPLRYAPNESRRELVSKWVSRNRILLVAVGLLGTTGIAAAVVHEHDAQRMDEIRRLGVAVAGEAFVADLEEAEYYFGLADRETEYRDKARETAQRALEQFGAWQSDDWFRRSEFQSLPPERLEAYRRQVARLMLLLANSRAQEAARSTDPAARGELLQQAADWNRRAEANHPTPEVCRGVWAQRAFMARLGGDQASAERYARQAESIHRDAADGLLEGRQFLIEGRIHAALKVLKEAAKADPKNFWAIFYASVCHQMLNEFPEALAGYDICGALRPGFFGTSYNRGQTQLRLGQVAEAEADFDRALEARPKWGDAHFQRAIAREALKRYPDAIDDLNRALELGYTPTSVLLLRSRVYGRIGDKKAAERDFAEAIKTVPTDERGWLARAHAQLYRDPAAALADYDQALKHNPRLVPALQGKAHLLGRAGKNAESAEALTRIIEINPESPDAWSGRGVVRARLNDRDGALSDACEALRLSQHPATKYQVAGIYAMTSKSNPEDRREAFSLLDAALRGGFGFDLIDKDPELDPIRKDPELKKTVEAARVYREALK